MPLVDPVKSRVSSWVKRDRDLKRELAEYYEATRKVVKAARRKFIRHQDDSGRGKTGWSEMDWLNIKNRLNQETEELVDAWHLETPDRNERVLEEAADVLNFAVFGAKSGGGLL